MVYNSEGQGGGFGPTSEYYGKGCRFMIIWIDGTYCVGKTSVAKRLDERLGDDIELLESDYYFDEMIKKTIKKAKVDHSFFLKGYSLPQNDMRFIKEFKKLIVEKSNNTNKNLIVDMALTQMECKKYLFDSLQEEGRTIVHIILLADEENLKLRIKKDENRMKEVALDWMKDNVSFLNDNYSDAMRIKTDNMSTNDIVDE
jgi:deoxyadenosine/deoxycytidine kinase